MMTRLKWKKIAGWITVLSVIGAFIMVSIVLKDRDHEKRLLQINTISEIREIQNSFPD